MPTTDLPALACLPHSRQHRVRDLLEARVSQLLEEVPDALGLLLEYGFAPLAQPALRRVLAPTVTLRQALALRPLPTRREAELLRRLAALAGEEPLRCR